ncbi:unnamed protein product, partial [Sphacelaria rigidula]
EAATQARIAFPGSAHFSFCRDPELWIGSRQFNTIYRNMQSTWLSYGAAERHPCILPELEKNIWAGGNGPAECRAIKEIGQDEQIWE